MKDILEDLDRWVAGGRVAATAMVVDVKRSAPRPPGSKMAINDDGDFSGAVSGGCVEGAVITAADEVLASGDPQLLRFGIADEEAWDVGLPCGGEIQVWIERFETGTAGDDPSPQAAFADLARSDGRGALVTLLRGESPVARLLVAADGATMGTLGDPALDRAALPVADELMWAERSEQREVDGTLLFIDAVFPKPRLIVFGAIDFAAELCAVARLAGWRPFVIDPRSRFARAERFPAAEQVVVGWPVDALPRIGGIDRSTAVAVLTHDPKLDDAALTIALRSDAAYIGAMGSRRAVERRRARLAEQGLTDQELARLSSPIGLDIGALTQPETALSIMAEVVGVRRGRQGGRLVHSQGGVHGLAGAAPAGG
jgi:xanthine dehydrogenase accessory factor